MFNTTLIKFQIAEELCNIPDLSILGLSDKINDETAVKDAKEADETKDNDDSSSYLPLFLQ